MTTLNVRIEEKTKKAARKALANIGLDMSSAVNMFLRQVVVEKGLPFTPTIDPIRARQIREKWDKGVERAIKRGKYYTSAKEMMKDLLKEDA